MSFFAGRSDLNRTAAPRDLLSTRRGAGIVIAGIVLLFLIPRVALLFAREPFFDELYTRWISRKSFAGILEALRSDSGPPLYYFVVHFLPASVRAMRVVSLLCATISLGAILSARSLGVTRFLAASLLAVFPPAVLFAVDARAYAMCAMFVTLAALALYAERPFAAALALVAAAYTHYYGALFMPLLLLRRDRRSFAAFAAACVAFAPGIALALRQPIEATGWVKAQVSTVTFEPLAQLSFAAVYPDALFRPAPVALVVLALVLFVVAIVRGWNRFAPMTLVPLALVLILGFLGRSAYVPMRFESVLAAPLVLWIATSLHAWSRPVRLAVALGLIVIGLLVVQAGVVDHFRRRVEPYRYGAIVAAATADRDPVVASGYLFLETVSVRPSTIPYPPDQAQHPGWRRVPTFDEALAAERALPSGSFIWVGERRAPELVALRRLRPVMLIFSDQFVVVARIGPRS
jgi:hypothetical protein